MNEVLVLLIVEPLNLKIEALFSLELSLTANFSKVIAFYQLNTIKNYIFVDMVDGEIIDSQKPLRLLGATYPLSYYVYCFDSC